MAEDRMFALMGTRRQTQVLALIALLGETYAFELSRLLDLSHQGVQNIIKDYQYAGIILSRRDRQYRRLCLDPNYFAYNELKALLVVVGNRDPMVQMALANRNPKRGVKFREGAPEEGEPTED
jgi:predicted transcriptional regulator